MCPDRPALRILIADDEAPARRQLRRVLDSLDDVELIGEASDGLEALRLTRSLSPDVLILDIQMPAMSGIDVAANLDPPAPQVIFATAFDEHAVRAFALAATDYLLKPWDTERLFTALERARGRRDGGAPPSPPHLGPMQRILVRSGDLLQVLDCAEILSIEAQDNYVCLHTASRDWLLREPISALLERIADPSFVRVHRSHAVNLAHVRAWRGTGAGDGRIELTNGREVPCSRSHRRRLSEGLARTSGPTDRREREPDPSGR